MYCRVTIIVGMGMCRPQDPLLNPALPLPKILISTSSLLQVQRPPFSKKMTQRLCKVFNPIFSDFQALIVVILFGKSRSTLCVKNQFHSQKSGP